MRPIASFLVALCVAFTARADEFDIKTVATDLRMPHAAATAFDGRVFVAEMQGGRDDKAPSIVEIKNGKAVPFATGFGTPDAPGAMIGFQKWLFVLNKRSICKVDAAGKVQVFVPEKAFTAKENYLSGIAVDERGVFYVTNSAAAADDPGRIYRIEPNGKVGFVALSDKQSISRPTAVVMDGMSHLIVAHNWTEGVLSRIRLSDGSVTRIGAVPRAEGLAWDWFGRLFIATATKEIWAIPRPGLQPVLVTDKFVQAGKPCIDPSGRDLLVPDTSLEALVKIPAQIPGYEFNDEPLAIDTEPAFPNLQWENWKTETDSGKVNELRPLLVTHAGDGTNRIFVPLQQGYIHVFPNDPKAAKTKLFLDIQKKVYWNDKENEQGLLGLAFHPNYKQTGEFFVFYTRKGEKLTNVLSRFRVSKTDPDRADPASEEEILRVQHKFWNHDGGTVAFGPDGFLYLCLGDGGSGGDPDKNGQNLGTLLAKVLRIDVDKKEAGKNYGIPKDNPFVGVAGARPEVWAYGLRNPSRMAFDKKTGKLWTSDVGQNLFEEIDIIEKGGNYGWSRREGLHPFGDDGLDANPKMIDPIWEYNHDVGKSMTGGLVYRGKALPELQGMYVYGDYITGRIWALQYDDSKKRVVANRPLERTRDLIMSFGEDETGEIYYLAATYSNRGIHRFVRSKK